MNCKDCNIHKVHDYVVHNINKFDFNSKCGQCITGFIKDLEQNFYKYKENRSK